MRILFLDLDTLRPDHLGCYGYHRCTSPNIDGVAAEGLRFTNYYCSDAPCLPSRAALMTGRFGIHTGVVGHGGTAADLRLDGRQRGFRDTASAANLPSIFRSAGLRTISISPFAERHAAWWFNAGFTEMVNTGGGGMESAEDVTPSALDWLSRNAGKDNWFLHLNYWDAHTPYRAPADFGNPFADDPLPSWLTPEVLSEHRKLVGPHKSREISMYDNKESPRWPRHPGELRNMDDVRRMVDGYDCGIRYMDGHIGQILAALEAAGVLDDTAIIITSDHGENMGELGIYGEHATADAITPRIPMIVKWPGGARGAVAEGLRYNLDLLPTLADLMGRPRHASWDGDSYSGLVRNDGCPVNRSGSDGRPYLVVSQCAHVCQRGVRFGDWMYVRTYHDGYHLLPKEMLFDIVRDPHEQTDLASTRRDICMEAVYYLNEWHDEMMSSMGSDVDPLWTVIREGGPLHARGHLPAYCDYLEKTDRGWAIPELKRRHPGEFKG